VTSIENQPGYARWRAAEEALKAAAERRDRAAEHEKAEALRDYYKAQEEYDAAVDALGFGDQ